VTWDSKCLCQQLPNCLDICIAALLTRSAGAQPIPCVIVDHHIDTQVVHELFGPFIHKADVLRVGVAEQNGPVGPRMGQEQRREAFSEAVLEPDQVLGIGCVCWLGGLEKNRVDKSHVINTSTDVQT